MARLAESTVVRHPDTHEPTFLEVGSEVPEWASDLIGDHLVAVEDRASGAVEKTPAKKVAPRKRATKTDA